MQGADERTDRGAEQRQLHTYSGCMPQLRRVTAMDVAGTGSETLDLGGARQQSQSALKKMRPANGCNW